MTTALCLILSTLLRAESQAVMTSLANQTYRLLNGDCPQSPSQNPPFCVSASPAGAEASDLGENLDRVAEDAFLASLAGERSEALECARAQTQDLLKRPDQQDLYLQDVTQKVELLAEAQYEASKLTTEVFLLTKGLASPGKEKLLEEKRKALRQAEARAQALEASIPLKEVPSLRQALSAQLTELVKVHQAPDFSEAARKAFQEKLKAALTNGDAELHREIESLRDGIRSTGTTLSRSLRESLAQDVDLVESVRKKSQIPEAELKAVSCRVDAKYGRGAQTRDLGLMAASVAAGGAAAGALRAGSIAASTAVTGARAAGQIASGAAGILRGASIAVESATVLDQFQKACLEHQPSLTGTLSSAKACATSALESLDHENCLLSTALGALGARAAAESVKSGLGTARALRAAGKKIEIPPTHRPERAIPFSGKVPDPDEIRSAGHYLRNAGDFEKLKNSPEFRDGTYVYMVVREPDGRDVLMLENRLPGAAEVSEGKYRTHRSLIQKYRDDHGGADPVIVAGGEGILNYRGEIHSVINRMGSAYEGNSSPDYLVDVMKASGIKQSENSRVITYNPSAGSVDAGHMDAAQAVAREKEVRRLKPGLIENFENETRNLQRNSPHLVYDKDVSVDWARSLLRPPADTPADKKIASKYIFHMMSYWKEGTSYGVAKMVERMKLDKVDVESTLDLVQRYFPEITREAKKKFPGK